MGGRNEAELFLRTQQGKRLNEIRPARGAQGGMTNMELQDFLQRNNIPDPAEEMAQSSNASLIRQVQSRANRDRTARQGILEALGHKDSKARPGRGVDEKYILEQARKQALRRTLEHRDMRPNSSAPRRDIEKHIAEQNRQRELERALDERDNRGIRPSAGRGADERYIANQVQRRAMRQIRPSVDNKPRQNRGDVEMYIAEQARRQALQRALEDQANRPTQTRAGRADERFLLDQSLRRAMGEIRPSGTNAQGISRAEIAKKYMKRDPRRGTQQAIENELQNRVGTRNPKHAIRREEA